MGTNFYAVLPVKKKVTKNLENAIELINNTPYDIDAIEAEIFDVKEEISKNRIHLGKRSGGWVFDWDANDLKYYEPVLKSIKILLNLIMHILLVKMEAHIHGMNSWMRLVIF